MSSRFRASSALSSAPGRSGRPGRSGGFPMSFTFIEDTRAPMAPAERGPEGAAGDSGGL